MTEEDEKASLIHVIHCHHGSIKNEQPLNELHIF